MELNIFLLAMCLGMLISRSVHGLKGGRKSRYDPPKRVQEEEENVGPPPPPASIELGRSEEPAPPIDEPITEYASVRRRTEDSIDNSPPPKRREIEQGTISTWTITSTWTEVSEWTEIVTHPTTTKGPPAETTLKREEEAGNEPTTEGSEKEKIKSSTTPRTGKVCARTIYYRYLTFPTYCMLEYTNCMERFELWQLAFMGECFNVTPLEEYQNYPYIDDNFLDRMVVMGVD